MARGGFPPPSIEQVRTNFALVRRRVDEAEQRSGRRDGARILAATKYIGVEEMATLLEAGIRLVGENRAQDLQEKYERYGDRFEYHFIGHLQRNKVRTVVPLVSMIESMDSSRLAREVARRAKGRIRVLVEVNVSGEQSKYGILPADAEGFLERVAAYEELDIVGLMTMAPLVDDPEDVRPIFRRLRELRDDLASRFSPRFDLTELSMGTSNDYEVAVEEGATIVRVGGALFAAN